MKSVGTTEPNCMVNSAALSGIATDLWIKREYFFQAKFEGALKKTRFTKLNSSDAEPMRVRSYRRNKGYIMEYTFKFEVPKRFFGIKVYHHLLTCFQKLSIRYTHLV